MIKKLLKFVIILVAISWFAKKMHLLLLQQQKKESLTTK